jgi:hypothetical protein
MNDEDVFSFEDVDEGGRPRVTTTPLPGSTPASSRSFATAPGALFARSPRPVASGVTRGEGRNKGSSVARERS